MAIDSVGHLFAQKLPLGIKKARARAVEHPELFLKGKATALIQVLITYTNLDSLSSPILFNRSRPAQILGVSTRTIDRLLKQLEGLGWLVRLPQPRLGDGIWGCTSITWAEWVRRDIFTYEAASDKWGKKQPRQQKKNSIQATGKISSGRATQTAHLSFSPKGEVFQNKVEDDNSQKPHFDPYGERNTTGRRIPSDLVEPMQELGLTAKNICWLMAKCKAKGVRLQQVLKATYAQLKEKGLRAKDAVAWLMYMISLDRDYGYEARQAEQAQRVTEKQERRARWLDRISDQVFTPGRELPNGRIVIQRSGGIVTLSTGNGHINEACPEVRLAQVLARSFPWWVRRVLRGKDSGLSGSTFSGDKNGATDQPTVAMQAKQRNARAESIAHLGAIKALLKPRSSFARV